MVARPLEYLRRPMQDGPSIIKGGSGARQWAGFTTVPSGSISTTVSTTMIRSDSMLRLGTVAVGSTGAAASSGAPLIVNSVVHGTSFAFARQNGIALPWNETISWEIVRTV